MARWTIADIPDLSGKHAIVTGGNVGLGFRSALELAKAGATVAIGCRRPDAGEAAIELITSAVPSANVVCIKLDLVDLDSVKAFAEDYTARCDRLDILLNNAAVVNLPTLQHTEQGHEMHMATNHYGHFALTRHLFPCITSTIGARVVTVSSTAYKAGEICFDDMAWRRREYHRIKTYGDSKLANLLFTRSLQRRFEEAGCDAISVAAHPGLTGTERQQSIGIGGWFTKVIASPVEIGVAPQLRAATDPNVKKCEYYGPRFGLRGAPVPEKLKGDAVDDVLAEELWQFTDELFSLDS